MTTQNAAVIDGRAHRNDTEQRHPSPNLGLLAVIFTVLKLASLGVVSIFTGNPAFPSPQQPPNEIVPYFQTYAAWVLWCAFLQFGSAIPFGLFAVSTVSRLRFLGIRAAGVEIALFGGLMVAFDSAASGFVLWALAQPDIASDAVLTQAMNFLQFAFGGPGFAVPLGLFLAGVSRSAGLTRLIPRWLMWFGLILAVIGELSWFSMVVPGALFLIPLTRFPAFVWLIAAGFLLPKSASGSTATDGDQVLATNARMHEERATADVRRRAQCGNATCSIAACATWPHSGVVLQRFEICQRRVG